MGKIKRKLLKPLNLLLLSCIIALSFLGIGYAYWNDSLEIITKIKMAHFKPMFCEQNLKFDNKDGRLDFDLREENTYLEITGTFDEEDLVKEKYKNVLYLCIKNNSSLPIKLLEPPKKIDNGVEYQLTLSSGIIQPGDSIQGKPKLTITIPKGLGPGNYPFKFDLVFKQWNEVGWEKTITIKGNIKILKSEKKDVGTGNILDKDSTSSSNKSPEIESNNDISSSTGNDLDTNVDARTNDNIETVTTSSEKNNDKSNNDISNDTNSDSVSNDIDSASSSDSSSDNERSSDTASSDTSTNTNNDSANNDESNDSSNDSDSSSNVTNSDTSNSDSGGEGDSNEE